MKRRTNILATALAACLTVGIASAQPPAPGRGAAAPGRGTPAPAVVSPEVHPDRTVTLRLRAPDATSVQLAGEITQGKGALEMKKGDNGIWSITVGPLPPEIWIYNFRIGGASLSDPVNTNIFPHSFNSGPTQSFVEVPGDAPAFYDAKPVPHGEVRIVTYESKAMGVPRQMWVYTPPGYDKSVAKYPVFYLLHGNGETQNGWVMAGRANLILDNLIAEKKALPMVLVMPQGHAVQGANLATYKSVPPPTGQPGMMNFSQYTTELLEQIIPMVQAQYRVYTDADHRAIGGLSMGSMQSIAIGLSHPELFHYVLAYSGGFGPMGQTANAAPMETQAPWKDLLAKSEETKKWLHLLFMGCGQQEAGLLGAGPGLVKLFKDKGINAQWADYPGGHVFSVWRNTLNYSAPMLFRASATAAKPAAAKAAPAKAAASAAKK